MKTARSKFLMLHPRFLITPHLKGEDRLGRLECRRAEQIDPVVVVRRLESPNRVIRGPRLGCVDDIAELPAINPRRCERKQLGRERS
jgi:hypothetical protein